MKLSESEGYMKVSASIDGLTLRDSGTALLAKSELKLLVDDLPVSIVFQSDSGSTRWETQGYEDTGVIVRLFNMANLNGEGVFTPISIAKSESVEYFLSFFVTTVGANHFRVVVYNILEKRAES